MYSEVTCWESFRFPKEYLPTLLRELKLSGARSGHADGMWRTVRYGRMRYKFEPMELLLTFLARMAYPSRMPDLSRLLGGRSPTAYSEAFSLVLNHIYTHFAPKIQDITRWAPQAAEFADAIHELSPCPRCIGFIDGTFRRAARPTTGQRQLYNGYYRGHGIKFQSVVGPNGLILDFFGPVAGRRSDGYLLRRSRFLARMARLCVLAGASFYVYGDPAYPLGRYLLRGFKGAMTVAQQTFSTAMSSVRETVEWGFALIVRDWTFVDFRTNNKLHEQPIGKLYFVAAIMANIKTCYMAEAHDDRGNQIASMFGVEPPTVHEYLYG